MLYVPLLQTKRGEFIGLCNLTHSIKKQIKPVFILTKDKCEARSTGLAKSIKENWDCYPFYIDLTRIPEFNIQSQNFIDFIFNDFMKNQLDFTPVIDVESPNPVIVNFVLKYNIQACIRINTQIYNGGTLKKIDDLITKLSFNDHQVDLLIDFEADVKSTRQAHSKHIEHYFEPIEKQFGGRVANIIVAGSSLPSELPRADYNPYGFEPRTEWLGFHDFTENLLPMIERPIFADYSIVHPEEQKPMDYVNPNAKIRYTISDSYMFAVGYQVLTHTDGYGQYHDISAIIVNSPYFVGAHFSWGDKYLSDCAIRAQGCGNMETWVKVGHNHHITFVTHQLASLYGISV